MILRCIRVATFILVFLFLAFALVTGSHKTRKQTLDACVDANGNTGVLLPSKQRSENVGPC